jgi:hypothetical protein
MALWSNFRNLFCFFYLFTILISRIEQQLVISIVDFIIVSQQLLSDEELFLLFICHIYRVASLQVKN